MTSTSHSHKRLSNYPSLSKLLFISACLLILVALAWPQATLALRANGIAAAWERARQSGAYHFAADIRQTTTPRATVRNVGRKPVCGLPCGVLYF